MMMMIKKEEEDSCGNHHGQEDNNNNNRYEEYLSRNPSTTIAYYPYTNSSHLTYQGVQSSSSSLNHPNIIMEYTFINQEQVLQDAIEVQHHTDNHNSNTWMEDVSTWLISTLKRRKKKMNKHKLQKRRKKERLGNKK
jgi:hypothetical protein